MKVGMREKLKLCVIGKNIITKCVRSTNVFYRFSRIAVIRGSILYKTGIQACYEFTR
jgi:hypothetical protein